MNIHETFIADGCVHACVFDVFSALFTDTVQNLAKVSSCSWISTNKVTICAEDVLLCLQNLALFLTGFIDVEEFIAGCCRIHGPAKAFQAALMAVLHQILWNIMKTCQISFQYHQI